MGEILDFFRVYHSMRYVHGKLVLRLHQAPDERAVWTGSTRISPTFWRPGNSPSADRCRKKRTSRPWPIYPRLIFAFNHRNFGRLRQLIDCLNKGELGNGIRGLGIWG